MKQTTPTSVPALESEPGWDEVNKALREMADIVEEKQGKRSIRVMFKAPGEEPVEKIIGADLKSWYAELGCELVEFVSWHNGMSLVIDEEGKIRGREPNIVLGEHDFIVGPFFVCGPPDDEGRTTGLSDEQMEAALGAIHAS